MKTRLKPSKYDDFLNKKRADKAGERGVWWKMVGGSWKQSCGRCFIGRKGPGKINRRSIPRRRATESTSMSAPELFKPVGSALPPSHLHFAPKSVSYRYWGPWLRSCAISTVGSGIVHIILSWTYKKGEFLISFDYLVFC